MVITYILIGAALCILVAVYAMPRKKKFSDAEAKRFYREKKFKQVK